MATPAVSENFGDLLEPGMRHIFDDKYKSLSSMLATMYDVRTSGTSYEKESSVGAFGDFTDFDTTGQIVYDEVSQGYDTKVEFKQWVSGFQVERKLFDKVNCQTEIWLYRWNSYKDNTEERLVLPESVTTNTPNTLMGEDRVWSNGQLLEIGRNDQSLPYGRVTNRMTLNRGHNLAICGNEPKASFTDEGITKEMEQCVNPQERLLTRV